MDGSHAHDVTMTTVTAAGKAVEMMRLNAICICSDQRPDLITSTFADLP